MNYCGKIENLVSLGKVALSSRVGSVPNGGSGSRQGSSDLTGSLLTVNGLIGIVELILCHRCGILGNKLGSSSQLVVVVTADYRCDCVSSPVYVPIVLKNRR